MHLPQRAACVLGESTLRCALYAMAALPLSHRSWQAARGSGCRRLAVQRRACRADSPDDPCGSRATRAAPNRSTCGCARHHSLQSSRAAIVMSVSVRLRWFDAAERTATNLSVGTPYFWRSLARLTSPSLSGSSMTCGVCGVGKTISASAAYQGGRLGGWADRHVHDALVWKLLLHGFGV